MPKRTQPPPAAMPKGQVFRQSAKKQKTAKPPSAAPPPPPPTKATTTPALSAAHKGKGKANGAATLKSPVSPVAEQPKSILKARASASSANGEVTKGKAAVTANALAAKSKSHRPTAKKSVTTPAPPTPRSFRVIVGSYERLLFGFHVKFDAAQDGSGAPAVSFTPLFSFAAHTSCISAVAAAGVDSKWLATGAGDETVRVWDLRKRKEVGGLTGHGGTIHSLSFPTRTYLLSADSSGLINLYRTRDWALLKTMRGHTGRVNACVAHPSGKVALSVGQDGMLRMWDLMRGKGAGAVRLRLGQTAKDDSDTYASRVKEEPLDVRWSPSGTRFVVMGRTEVVVFKTDMSKVASIVARRDDPKRRFGSVAWLNDTTVMAGTESGVVDVYHVSDDALQGPIAKLVGHDNRIRGLRAINVRASASAEEDTTLAVTASSDGSIRLYDLSDLSAQTPSSVPQEGDASLNRLPIGVHSTGGARLTSLEVVGGSGVRTAAMDSIETDADEDSEEDDDDEDDDDEDDDEDDDDEDDDDAVQLEDDDDEDDDDDDEADTDSEDGDMNAEEIEEINDLLDLLEEARAQGIEVEGMSDFASSDDDDDEGESEAEDEEEEAESE